MAKRQVRVLECIRMAVVTISSIIGTAAMHMHQWQGQCFLLAFQMLARKRIFRDSSISVGLCWADGDRVEAAASDQLDNLSSDAVPYPADFLELISRIYSQTLTGADASTRQKIQAQAPDAASSVELRELDVTRIGLSFILPHRLSYDESSNLTSLTLQATASPG